MPPGTTPVGVPDRRRRSCHDGATARRRKEKPMNKPEVGLPTRDHVTSTSDVAVISYEQAIVSPRDDSGIMLVETTLREHFSGGLNGDAIAKHLRVVREDGTETFTCVERFTGSLDGRAGSFALTAAGFT